MVLPEGFLATDVILAVLTNIADGLHVCYFFIPLFLLMSHRVTEGVARSHPSELRAGATFYGNGSDSHAMCKTRWRSAGDIYNMLIWI